MDKGAIAKYFDRLAHNNRALINGEIKGIMLYFRGLSYTLIEAQDTCGYEMCAENGILFLFVQYNPWCWMNDKAVNYTDAIIDVAIGQNGLEKDVPVGIYGGSMGGFCAFRYAEKSKHNIAAVCVNCPCVDIEYECFNGNNGILRTYFDSVMEETDDFFTYIKENSPLNRVDKLPRIPYRIAVGHKDETLYPTLHSFAMIEKMQAAGHDVTRVDFPQMGHCNYSNEERVKEQSWVVEKILNK